MHLEYDPYTERMWENALVFRSFMQISLNMKRERDSLCAKK